MEPIILANETGVEVHVLRIGAVIQRLLVPTKDGSSKVDVVLGFEDASAYKDNPNYLGAIVGRCANRIARGAFSLGGVQHQLATNNGRNALHGGPTGFHVREWSAQRADTAEGQGVELTYTSADGEEGYPGALRVVVTYRLAAGAAELRTSIHASSDTETLVNIAQHSYFNLCGAGSGDSVEAHVLHAPGATTYTPVDATLVPTGDVACVAGTPFDFASAPRSIGERLGEAGEGGSGYDHNLVLHGLGRGAKEAVVDGVVGAEPHPALTLTEPSSGRTLSVSTNAPALQLYTGGFLDGTLQGCKGGARYGRFGGMCLETQGFPDAVNQPAFPSVTLAPGKTYAHEIVYRFSYV